MRPSKRCAGLDTGWRSTVAEPVSTQPLPEPGQPRPVPTRGRTASLRLRITLTATAVAGLALVLGAVIFHVLLHGALMSDLRAAIERDIDVIAAQAPPAGGSSSTEEDEDRFFQIISGSGTVLASSGNAPATAVELPDEDGERIIRIPSEDEQFLVLAGQRDDNGPIVVVGRSLEEVDETLGTVAALLGGTVPLLIGLMALSTWLVAGRALAPVERMRRQVDEISAASLDRRVADPGRADEIGRLAATMNRMLDRLEQSQHAQRQFISDASHELKSPLASLRQYADVAQTHPERVGTADLSRVVLDEGGRLERLVQGMLVLARADEHSLETSRQEVDLDDLVLRQMRRLHGSTHLKVDASKVGAARIRGNEALLEQVVRNLVDNAARHASAWVSLSLSMDDNEAVLAVDDDGPGVPGAERERVFERFVRLDEARTRDAGGSGLGLSIVREIVHVHGGTIRISDGPLGGARFEVRLPAVVGPAS